VSMGRETWRPCLGPTGPSLGLSGVTHFVGVLAELSCPVITLAADACGRDRAARQAELRALLSANDAQRLAQRISGATAARLRRRSSELNLTPKTCQLPAPNLMFD